MSYVLHITRKSLSTRRKEEGESKGVEMGRRGWGMGDGREKGRGREDGGWKGEGKGERGNDKYLIQFPPLSPSSGPCLSSCLPSQSSHLVLSLSSPAHPPGPLHNKDERKLKFDSSNESTKTRKNKKNHNTKPRPSSPARARKRTLLK